MSYHSPSRGPWDEPWGASCKSCGMPVGQDEASEEVRFPDGFESNGMNGTYHAECARPFASLARALTMLSRGFS